MVEARAVEEAGVVGEEEEGGAEAERVEGDGVAEVGEAAAGGDIRDGYSWLVFMVNSERKYIRQQFDADGRQLLEK